MSYTNAPSHNLGGDSYISQRIGNISLQNDFNEGMYSGPHTEPYDPHGGGQWDYQPRESRQDAIVTDLTPEEVRWFYKTDGEKRWLEFSGYDSYRIEMRYREMYLPNKDFGNRNSSYSAFSGTYYDEQV